MYVGDQGEIRSEPWTYSRDQLPVHTRSLRGLEKCGVGRPLRVRYRRKPKKMTEDDVLRMLLRLTPPDDTPPQTWAKIVIAKLKEKTLDMLEQLLWMIPPEHIEELYDWSIQILDKLLGLEPSWEGNQNVARRYIMEIADKAGLLVEITQ